MPSRSKSVMFRSRNSAEGFKAEVRRTVACGQGDDVLELFAGDGRMFAHRWNKAGAGATMDMELSCAERAARERPLWTVIKCDAETALRTGIWKTRAFTIIDVDCYGSPWKFLAALFLCRREMPDRWTLVLTDHYMIKRNLSREDKVLACQKPSTPEQYLSRVDALIARLIPGLKAERKTYKDGMCVQHVVTLTRSPKPAEPAVSDIPSRSGRQARSPSPSCIPRTACGKKRRQKRST